MSEDLRSSGDASRITKSLSTLTTLTQDMMRDIGDAQETEAFTALAEEIDSIVSRLADGYMTLKLRLALTSTPDAEVPAATTENAPSDLEQLLFPGQDNTLLDNILAHETSCSLSMMDSDPSPLDVLCNAPLEPDRTHSADTLNGSDALLGEFPDIFEPAGDRCQSCNSGPATPAEPVEDRPPSAERLRSWHEEGGSNLRALLASLHTVVPPGSTCAWEKTTLGQLVSDNTVKRAYQRSLLAVHPDKLPPPQREAGQKIFDTLRDAWGVHNNR